MGRCVPCSILAVLAFGVVACDVKTSGDAPPGTAAVVVSPTTLAFPTTLQSRFANLDVVVTNLGLAPAMLSNPSGLTTPFSVLTPFPVTIPALGSATLTFRFQPTSPGTFSDTFTMQTNDPAKPTVSISMSGTGVDATKITLALPGTAPLVADSRIFRVTDTRAIALSPGSDGSWSTGDDRIIVLREGSPPTIEVVLVPGLSPDQPPAIDSFGSVVYVTNSFGDAVVRLAVGGATTTVTPVLAGVPLGPEVVFSPLFVGNDNAILAAVDVDTTTAGNQSGAVFVSFSPGPPLADILNFDTDTPPAGGILTHGSLIPTALAGVPHTASPDRFAIALPGPDLAYGGGDDRILMIMFSTTSGFTLLFPFHVEVSSATLPATTWNLNPAISRPFVYTALDFVVDLTADPTSGTPGEYFTRVTISPLTAATLDLTAAGATLTPLVDTDGGGTGAQLSFYMNNGPLDDFLTTIVSPTTPGPPTLISTISTGGLPVSLADAEIMRFATDDVGYAHTDLDQIRRVNLDTAAVTVLTAPLIAGPSAAPALIDAENLVATAAGISGVHLFWLATTPPTLTTTAVAGISSMIVSRSVLWSSSTRTFLVGSPGPTNTITVVRIP